MRPSLPPPASLSQVDVSEIGPRDRLRQTSLFGDPFSTSTVPSAFSSFPDRLYEGYSDRRPSSSDAGRSISSASAYSLQCVGQRNIPGEGLCYVFKDGSTCPTVIDGEAVNPLWGTTKAGKARKRLAQACLNCREKKIKCEPGDLSCVQCEKAKRECHRPPNQQSQAEMATGVTLTMPSLSPARGDWSSQTSASSVVMNETQAQPQTLKRRRSAQTAQQESIISQFNTRDDSSRDVSPRAQSKRRRSEQTSSPAIDIDEERLRKDSKRISEEDMGCTIPDQLDTQGCISWDEDPFQIEPEGTLRFLELFFAHSASEKKPQRECMVLYALLALGSIFSKDEYSSFSKLCGDRASQAVSSSFGRPSTALIQARLILSTYSHLKGKDSLAWDLSGSAIRAASIMKLNTEEGCGESSEQFPYYSVPPEQMRECKRRTFWAAFLQDQYNGFCGDSLSMLQPEDIYLRLPCAEATYEAGGTSQASFYRNSTIDPELVSPQLADTTSPVAQTISVATLWQRVVNFIQRSSQRSSTTYSQHYESFYNEMQKAFSEWISQLPAKLQYNRENLIDVIQTGEAGNFVMMHVLYNISQLKAARMVRHLLLSPQHVKRSIRVAHFHASQLLTLVCDVRAMKLQSYGEGKDLTTLMTPFVACAIISAIDTLSANGLSEELVTIRNTISSAVVVLHDLSQFCTSVKAQAKMAASRLQQIEVVLAKHNDHMNGGRSDRDRVWTIEEPMEKHFPSTQDVIYGTCREIYLAALRDGR
ncbi:hypothetical protein MBLNU459_g1574t2 [Dothideomycetes sp. NU459]